MTRKKILLKDGRYLIYYSFKQTQTQKPETGGQKEPRRGCARPARER